MEYDEEKSTSSEDKGVKLINKVLTKFSNENEEWS
jgi:hypothetical protein